MMDYLKQNNMNVIEKYLDDIDGWFTLYNGNDLKVQKAMVSNFIEDLESEYEIFDMMLELFEDPEQEIEGEKYFNLIGYEYVRYEMMTELMCRYEKYEQAKKLHVSFKKLISKGMIKLIKFEDCDELNIVCDLFFNNLIETLDKFKDEIYGRDQK